MWNVFFFCEQCPLAQSITIEKSKKRLFMGQRSPYDSTLTMHISHAKLHNYCSYILTKGTSQRVIKNVQIIYEKTGLWNIAEHWETELPWSMACTSTALICKCKSIFGLSRMHLFTNFVIWNHVKVLTPFNSESVNVSV